MMISGQIYKANSPAATTSWRKLPGRTAMADRPVKIFEVDLITTWLSSKLEVISGVTSIAFAIFREGLPGERGGRELW